jgi:hypothetical protein
MPRFHGRRARSEIPADLLPEARVDERDTDQNHAQHQKREYAKRQFQLPQVVEEQLQHAGEQEAPFYPKRYLSEIVSLNVQPKTTPGEYSFVVSVRDEVGQQALESRQKFRVE